MKLIHVFTIVAIISIYGCKHESTKQDLPMERALIQEKNYPKTKNFPKADQFDKSMEADFVRAANTHPKKELTAQNAIITSREWVVYNDLNGNPIKRNRIAVITTQIDDRCFLQHMFFQQDANGNSYDETYVTDMYGWKEFDCSLKNK